MKQVMAIGGLALFTMTACASVLGFDNEGYREGTGDEAGAGTAGDNGGGGGAGNGGAGSDAGHGGGAGGSSGDGGVGGNAGDGGVGGDAGHGESAGGGGAGGSAGHGGAGGDAGGADPCAGVTCDTPTASSCKDETTLTAYGTTGTCSGGTCTYTPTDEPCANGCANGACIPPVNAWATWPMPNPASAGLPNPASYTVSADKKTVKDNVTGLTWQRDVDVDSYTWADANTHCQNLTLGGLTGWRLPSRIELVSLVDWTRSDPAINIAAFSSTTLDKLWSSSPLANDSTAAWTVEFSYGKTFYENVSDVYRARCVHGGVTDPPSERYTFANGTVYDTQTKLTWEQSVLPSTYTLSGAKTYCANPSLDGSGWRLPSLGELQTLIDESGSSPAIDTAAFLNTPSERFWSSSPYDGYYLTNAWVVDFAYGGSNSTSADYTNRVRCVR